MSRALNTDFNSDSSVRYTQGDLSKLHQECLELSLKDLKTTCLLAQANLWGQSLPDEADALTSKSAMLTMDADVAGLPQALRILQFFLQTFPAIDTYTPNILGNSESFAQDHVAFIVRRQLEPLFEACDLESCHSSLERACGVQRICLVDLREFSLQAEQDDVVELVRKRGGPVRSEACMIDLDKLSSDEERTSFLEYASEESSKCVIDLSKLSTGC